MFLTIPISNLLDSQLDVGIDPLSGNFTYNIKDTPSRLQYDHGAENLILTLQSSSQDSNMCLRICTNSVADSARQSTDTSQALEFAPAPLGLATRSDQYHTRSTEIPGQSIPDAHNQDFLSLPSGYENPDVPNGTYSLHLNDHELPEPMISAASLWEEKGSGPSQEPRLMSPISETLSLITSGSIFEADSTMYESDNVSGYRDFQYNANCLRAYTAWYASNDMTHFYPSESTNKLIDGQDHLVSEGSADASSSCTPPATVVFSGSGAPVHNYPLPQRFILSSASQMIETGVAIEDDKSVLEPRAESNNQEASPHNAFPTASSSIPDGRASESRPQPRGGKHEGYPCPHATCHRVLKSLYTQQLHMKTHIAKPRKNITCTMGCSESFTRHHDRLRHEVSQHGKHCEFSCKRCDRFFSSQRMLDRHTCWSSRIGLLRWQLKDCSDPHSEA